MKKHNRILTALIAVLLMVTSCKDDLNLTPTNDYTADVAYSTPEGYKRGIAKVYGSIGTSANQGPSAAVGDIGGIDAGTSDFIRAFWMAQELPTDEVACAWVNDPGIAEMNHLTFTPSNVLVLGLYARSIYQITLVNEFLRESTDAKVSGRGISGADADEIKHYVNEARFLRAFQYWVLMDIFGNPPFITEESSVGKESPKQITRAELFKYVESELLAVEGSLKETNEYGRVSQGAAWALLARLYLNAAVYTGTAKFTEAAQYAEKVINSGRYSLSSSYANIFKADNNTNNQEIILSINYDGVKTQNFGGTTYLINAAINADMNPTSFGVPNGGWGGNRSRANLSQAFGDYKTTRDKRAMFFGDNPQITDISVFKEGIAVTKFSNITSTGETAPSIGGTFCSTDFPLFRLSEMYLIYAESVLRGGAGNSGTALTYVNLLRARAYGDTSGNLGSLTLENIFNERSRELYWEGFRRTDLIRYGRFTEGSYLWQFKGGVINGRAVESYRNLYPLPATDVIANTNLVQNTGY